MEKLQIMDILNSEDDLLGLFCIGYDSEKIQKFITDITEIISDENNSIREYEKKINMYLNSRKKIDGVDDAVLTVLGDRLIRGGENEKGIILLKNALKRPSYGEYTDGITLFMRLAENEFI